jgi:hypothetical protein
MSTVTQAVPSPVDPDLLSELHELEAEQEAGDFGRADEHAASLLARFPQVAVVLVEIARLRARQGRYDEAMELLHRDAVGKNVRVLNYRLCAPLRPVDRASA